MRTYLFEAVNGREGDEFRNWGKFLVGVPDVEWEWRSEVSSRPLLSQLAWNRKDILVLDLSTGEGAVFTPGGSARMDLRARGRWVCVLFEAFLTWLYQQDLTGLDQLPSLVELPDVPVDLHGLPVTGTGAHVNHTSAEPVSPAGEVLQAWLTDAHITAAQLAAQLVDATPDGAATPDETTVQGILDGTARITLEIASALGRCTKITTKHWLDLQEAVDANQRAETLTTGKITAPFSADQVKALNAFQESALMHPFTCGTDSSHGSLKATPEGWQCPTDCGYTQNWAHRFMTDGSWRSAVPHIEANGRIRWPSGRERTPWTTPPTLTDPDQTAE